MCIIKNSLAQSHQIIESIVDKRDLVVDATAGNGNDTVFLAGLVGEKGRVFSFDIQERALKSTERKLMDRQLRDRMELITVHGIISIVVYYGGDSGFDEKDEVMDFIRTIDCKQFTVMRTDFVNQINCPPILICIEKNK